MPFIDAGGLSVHYELSGPPGGEVVLFSNSLGTNLHAWDAQVAALQDRYRVLRYDTRGHGMTEATSPPYTMETLGRDALALLDALKIEKAHVCGLSIGGMVAQRLATLAPERVRSLILCDTGNKIGPPTLWEDRIAAVKSQGLAALAEGGMQRWFTAGYLKDHPAEVRGYMAMMSRNSTEGYIGCCAALRDADLAEQNRQIECPTLVIVGDQDVATSPALAKALADGIEGARLEIVSPAAHIASIEAADQMNRVILDFLAEQQSADLYERGLATRRAVLGDAHVERATRNATDLDRDFQAFITRQAWGEVWTGKGLDRRTRSIVTIALLAGLGHHDEVKLHIRATRNTGATLEDVKEALMHVAIYAGVPAANTAFKLAKETYLEMEKEGSS